MLLFVLLLYLSYTSIIYSFSFFNCRSCILYFFIPSYHILYPILQSFYHSMSFSIFSAKIFLFRLIMSKFGAWDLSLICQENEPPWSPADLTWPPAGEMSLTCWIWNPRLCKMSLSHICHKNILKNSNKKYKKICQFEQARRFTSFLEKILLFYIQFLQENNLVAQNLFYIKLYT